MTIQIRRSQERKYFDHSWLKTFHTFSFASYYDPKYMGFRDLRVINEDRVSPDHGFPPHEHEDMEIISLVLEGELAHEDSMGNRSVIHAHEVQVMSAGKGIRHSEYNASDKTTVHFLQIWILPDQEGITPHYQQAPFPSSKNEWALIASKSEREKSLKIHQDVEIFLLSLEPGMQIEKKLSKERYGWLQVIEGDLSLNDEVLHSGDGAAIEGVSNLKIKAQTPSRVLFFDLK